MKNEKIVIDIVVDIADEVNMFEDKIDNAAFEALVTNRKGSSYSYAVFYNNLFVEINKEKEEIRRSNIRHHGYCLKYFGK